MMIQQTGTAAANRRFAVTAVALLTSALLVGCDGRQSSPQAAPPPPPDPKQELLAAVPNEEDPPFRWSGRDLSGEFTGVVDPANKGMTLNTVFKEEDLTLELSFRLVESRIWTKVKFKGSHDVQKLLKLPTKWMELDPAKVESESSLPKYEGTDPGNTKPIIRIATDIQAGEDGTYTGMVDLTANPSVADQLEGVDALGDAAAQVPLTAVVGPDGNLASLSLALPAAGKQKASKYTVKYFDFGSAPAIVAFTDDQAVRAPASVYDLFNS